MRDTLDMTIGIDGSRAFIFSKTGTENYSFQLIRNLSFIDTQNSYLIYLNRSQISVVSSQKWPNNFEFKVINLPRFWTQVGLAFRTFIDPIDVLFVPAHTLPLIRRPNLKTVVTVHDLGAEYLPAFHQLKQVLYLNLMTHYQLKTATHLIAVSEATKNDLRLRVGVGSDKVSLVYEGVDKTVFKKLSNDVLSTILSKHKLHKNKYFLFVGTIQPRKNLERLIRGFGKFLELTQGSKVTKVADESSESKESGFNVDEALDVTKVTKVAEQSQESGFKLVIVGGNGWKSEGIYKLPKELGVEDRVSFLGRVPDQELVGLYNGATALAYPSLFEGFGLPIIEAFACQCPVITSDTSSMPEIAGKAGLLVDPYNIEAISKAMSLLSSNDLLRSSLIKKGILRSKSFDWKDAAEKTLRVIRGVMSDGL